tara:strand:- start:50 stop:586 length:537 start_codon:yes stop_codon:yes gene_type:complete
MVLYILRHEQRNLDKVGFFTPLNMAGTHNAKINVYSKFNDKSIDAIYSSPYKRALDTISNAASVMRIPIKIDWALSEKVAKGHSAGLIWPTNIEQRKFHDLYDYDKRYKPIIDINYITCYDESIDNYLNRVDKFCQFIETQKDKNILIVSHQSITNRIIEKLGNATYKLSMGECYEIE